MIIPQVVNVPTNRKHQVHHGLGARKCRYQGMMTPPSVMLTPGIGQLHHPKAPVKLILRQCSSQPTLLGGTCTHFSLAQHECQTEMPDPQRLGDMMKQALVLEDIIIVNQHSG